MTILTMLENGRLRTQDANGRIAEIGPEHPDYQRLAAECRSSIRPTARSRLTALAFILTGAGCWWYVWHQLLTEGSYDLRASIVAPVGVFGGLLMLFWPQFCGPWREDGPEGQKISNIVTVALMLSAYAVNNYLMQHYRP